MQTIIKNTLTVLLSIFLTLLVVEGGLRFLPVNEGLWFEPVDANAPYAHFSPNRTSTWSKLPDFSMTNSVHTNNYGFVNDQDYDRKSSRPLLAVIGDSFVEAVMVAYPNTLQGRLSTALDKEWRVYSFGASGAPLSQYLAYAKFTRDEFSPDKLVVVVVGNDFDESLMEYKSSPGYHYFTPNNIGKLELDRVDYHPSWKTWLVKNSKLAMYLLTNVHVIQVLQSLKVDKGITAYVGQTDAKAGNRRVALSMQAVAAFLDKLPAYSGVSSKDIIFVVDSMRPHIYSPQALAEVQNSFASIMRRHFIDEAQTKGFVVIDMDTPFMDDYARNGNRFEYPEDGHWNPRGHNVVAQAVLKALGDTAVTR